MSVTIVDRRWVIIASFTVLTTHTHTHTPHRQLAVSLLDEMLELGAPPDMVTFASAMLACERAKQWVQVLRIMDQVLSTKGTVEKRENKDRGRGKGSGGRAQIPTCSGLHLAFIARWMYIVAARYSCQELTSKKFKHLVFFLTTFTSFCPRNQGQIVTLYP